MKIALIPATRLSDPTYGRVCRGLARALADQGLAARAFDPNRPHRVLAFAPNIIHVHCAGRLPAATRALLAAARKAGSRLVLTFQDFDHPDHPRRTAAQTRMIAAQVRAARRVTALTPHLARAVCAAYPDSASKMSVVGNGVGRDWLAAAGSGAGGILAAARLAPYKGVDLLLWSFRGLLEREPTSSLTICGGDFSGGHYQELARRLGLGRRVRFLGRIGERRLRQELSRARFFVSSSRAETYGLAALEAMAAGRAVLAARTGAARAWTHGREAWLFAPGDLHALERGLLRLWRDPALRRRLARSGRGFAAAQSWDDRARRYAKIYRRAAGRA